MGKLTEGQSADEPADIQSFLLAMYKEQTDQARQHEALRKQSTTIALTVSGAILTAATATSPSVMQGLCALNMPWLFAGYALLGLFLVALGWFGRTLSLKHYERNRYHTTRAEWYRTELEKMTGRPDNGKLLRDGSSAKHEKRWKESWKGRDGEIVHQGLHKFWMQLYYFVIAIGVVCRG
jgi:hypothetical protein